MKIYTKTGDGGKTSLIGGRRIDKDDPRVEAYGAIDELMAHTAHLMDSIEEEKLFCFKPELKKIIDKLMVASSVFACDETAREKIPLISGDDIKLLEKRIDEIQDSLPAIEKFTIPGGHILVSLCHIARTVCRRAERRAVKIADKDFNGYIFALGYLNRLSDYFYVLGRKFTYELGVKEILWEP
ncbi:MAG: cob(I)yrinic acid a,c-diamide adenosyltransferase [Rikenellaceae bacterium]|nr:cob(I)yrinic acid a,c-diamide adenosyltransferase [Rikenellaceae bacterium]